MINIIRFPQGLINSHTSRVPVKGRGVRGNLGFPQNLGFPHLIHLEKIPNLNLYILFSISYLVPTVFHGLSS